MPCDFSPLRSHSYARERLVCGCTFLSLDKKVRKKRVGASPLNPAPLAAHRSPCRQGKAQRCWQVLCLHLGGIIAPPRWVWRNGAMPNFRRTHRLHIENGEVGLKPFWETAGNASTTTLALSPNKFATNPWGRGPQGRIEVDARKKAS